MVIFKAHFDGKVIVPDEPVSLVPNQKLRVTVEADDTSGQTASADPKPRRAAGFAKGMFVMRDDFNDPLEEFAEYE